MFPKKYFRKIAIFSVVLMLLIVGTFYLRASNYSVYASNLIWDKTHIPLISTFISPQNTNLNFEIGNYYFGGGAYDLKKAEKYYRKILEVNPLFPLAHYQIARIEFVAGNLYYALDEINKEIEINPDFKRSYYVRGLINGYNGDLKNAASDFKEFLKWKKESWAGWNDLSWVYFTEGDYKNAKYAAIQGLVYFPQNPWLLNSYGVALINLGEKDKAREVLIKAKEILSNMTENDWGVAYPGNNPDVYKNGFESMKNSVEKNLKLTE